MRRNVLIACGLGMVGIAVGAVVLGPSLLPAQPPRGGEAAAGVKAQVPQPPLPISQVILFSSGVGYFQREGEVEGNSRIDLSFPTENINDLLKSMVLRDLAGGLVNAVSYDSQDPVERTLRSFALDLTENPTFGQLLNQARGEKVEVVQQQTNVTQPGTLTGTIVGIEKQKQPAGKDSAIEVEFLNLWCADGMRAVRLADVQRVRFLNPVIEGELKRALEVLALSHDTRKKTVSINFAGQGRRPVRVGYVIENPIWKTSYRLVLGKDSKVLLQGWAVVENTGDEDWNNVSMSLVSGRPISFQMDLYAPLYLKRPVVEPELFASLRPPTYSGSMPLADAPMREKEVAAKRLAAEPAMPTGGAGFGALGLAGGESGRGRPGREEQLKQLGDRKATLFESASRSVASAATATDMGDFFQYVIDQPVSLARQKSAMLPIVNQEVEGVRVSIYNQSTHAKFPLLGLKFKNTTPLHLMQGPITVFDGNSYAGDSRIMDLQPKEERLLSYAIDLGTEVEPVAKRDADKLNAVKLYKGLLISTSKVRETRTYNVKNRSTQDRLVVLEHPFRADFKLVTPEKATERSRDVYRFDIPVAAGQTASQEIVEERDLVQQIALTNIDEQTVRFFTSSTVVSPKVKAALAQVLERKTRLSSIQRDIQELDKQLKEITADQTRLRANLRELPPTAAAYKRYLEKFDTQESEIEKLQTQLKTLREAELQQRKDLDAFLASLEVE